MDLVVVVLCSLLVCSRRVVVSGLFVVVSLGICVSLYLSLSGPLFFSFIRVVVLFLVHFLTLCGCVAALCVQKETQKQLQNMNTTPLVCSLAVCFTSNKKRRSHIPQHL